ncbi:MAG TPA: SDR family NAD(P)-dependent oxidoreductase [Microthrixaceae bacterium]|nr:SDR family NAD(P)-dependent oxidoreductase [Microthrixaceae bacterium]
MRDALGGVQSVLLLGGRSDIGLELVERLAKDRCETVVLAGRRPEDLADAAERVRQAGASTVDTVAFDGADSASHEKVLGAIFDQYPRIDMVVSAFGQLGDQQHLASHPAEAAELVQVNLAGQISALLVVAERMQRQGQGVIIVFSSVAGERVRPDNAVYGATKAGLDGFAQALSDQLVGTGVDVMIVRPGFVHTKMTEGRDAAPFSTTPDKVVDDILTGLQKRSVVVWSPKILRWVFTVFRHLPRPI